MAFTSIPDSLIQVGKAITRTLWSTYVKDSLDDLDARSTSLEASAGKIILFNDLILNAANYSSGATITGLDIYISASTFTLTDCKIAIFEKGSLTGTLEVDIKKSTTADFSTNVSVFTTKPSINYATASDFEESSNAVFDITNKDITAGDYLRIDVTSLPASGTLGKFVIQLIGEPT